MQDQADPVQPQPEKCAEPSGLEILGVTPTAPRRRRTATIVVAAVLALGVVAGATWTMIGYGDDKTTADASGPGGTSVKGIKGLTTYAGLLANHVTGEVDYPQSPPVGGEHAAAWLACGVYDVPVRNENVVHDLEHGTVWISHREGLPDSDLAKLRDVLPENGIMAPYPGLTSTAVLTVWGVQLHVDSVKDPRIKQFIAAFGHGETSPEPGTSCAGGLSNPDGSGVPVEPGTSV